MSQPPPIYPIDYGTELPRPRTSAAAVASLILGILGCIPLITGLLAILLGIIGIRTTRNTSFSGRGVAIAGLILGMLSVVGWTGFAGFLGFAYVESKPARVVARQFLTDVCAGNIPAAAANSAGIPATQLQADNAQFKSFGSLQNVSFNSFNYSAVNGQTTVTLDGSAAFGNGSKDVSFTLTKQAGTFKVTRYTVQ